LGGRIGADVTAIDAGDGTTMHRVMAFATPRRRKVLAIKGVGGNRPLLERSQSKTKGGGRLWIVGVDTGKQALFARLSRGGSIRLSSDLPLVWHEQVASERQVTRYRRGQPQRSFERIPGKRAEALDCLVYAFAARQAVSVEWPSRRDRLSRVEEITAAPAARAESNWLPADRKDWL
jgi:phage terminase large subunit GpA-like protein